MLKVGDRAPDFTARTTDDREVTLSGLRGKNVVLYFFPKAFTTGCTIEAKQFRDASPDLQAFGAEVFGVSTDEHERQCEFATSIKAASPMIGDADSRISKSFGILWPILGLARRVTFVIDREGVIRGVFHHELQVGKHVDGALELLRRLPKERFRTAPRRSRR